MRRPLYDAASHCFSIALFLGQGLAVQTAPKALAIRRETLESFLRPAPWHQLLVAPSHPAKVVEDLNSIYRDGLQIPGQPTLYAVVEELRGDWKYHVDSRLTLSRI